MMFFEGMHPRFRQVPPRVLISRTATFILLLRAALAMDIPDPEPITMTSYSFINLRNN
jgi:hypothetical protein